MMKKLISGIVVMVMIILGGVFYMNQQSHNPDTGILDKQEVQLYKHGFRLLEEQIATYIKEHYTGVSKIEFSPIFIQGDNKHSMFSANVVPAIYDKHGKKAILGGDIGNTGYESYGLLAGLHLDFNGADKEVIELEVEGQDVDVSGSKHLPNKAKLTSSKKIDENIEALVKDGQLKEVVKNDSGSPKAEVVYNTEIKKGKYWEWR
ncbi:hypothetical protein [Streptococcus intermedius]|uniref:hypothetical protein n=2 Tax=Streptococcus intermedius TaxID=1338 RepID=UPI0005646EDC|nr:hypothetical protein [Streptococcus intermedius]QKH77945.1 hypothetical protein FOC71_05345 [Streptococcus intermedius]